MTPARIEVAAAVCSATTALSARAAPRGQGLRGLLGISRRQGRARRDARKRALARELHEELGIDVERVLSVAHARLRLRARARAAALLSRDALVGRAARPREPALSRGSASTSIAVSPLLPANGPILRALALPDVLRHQQRGGGRRRTRFCARLAAGACSAACAWCRCARRASAARGARCDWRARRSRSLARWRCRCCSTPTPELARRCRRGRRASHRRAAHATRDTAAIADLVGASCHDAAELDRAAGLGLDFVVLGPVQETASHPGARTLGWDAFRELVADYPLPVYAIGGLARAICEARGRRARTASRRSGARGRKGTALLARPRRLRGERRRLCCAA